MKAATIRSLLRRTKPPLNLFTSDGEVVYVDHPEAVLVSAAVIAVDPGARVRNGVSPGLVFINPDHLVRIQHTKRKPLRRLAGGR
jgi:hypothetical protein